MTPRQAAGLAMMAAAVTVSAPSHPVEAGAVGTGTISGHVRLVGGARANPLIRMGMDPACAAMRQGQRPTQDIVVVDASGGLANVFVAVRGAFPRTPVPSAPVVLDQRGCLYSPRVVGARVGQALRVHNSDGLLHNVHARSVAANGFNVGQPSAGMTFDYKLSAEEVMVRVGCDVHSWMTAYVGVLNHPYFTVSGAGGAFEIDHVPAGEYPLESWHEQFGTQIHTVKVAVGRTTAIDVTYTASSQP